MRSSVQSVTGISPVEHPNRIREVAGVFLKLGLIGFGGPAAHIALMRDELVRRRGWVQDDEFIDLVGATNLIPGPNSTELAIHLGQRRAGWRGLMVAGLGFIVPASVIVGFIAWLYAHYGTDPAVADLRYGILPVMIAIITHALVGLGRVALTSVFNWVIGVLALAAYLADVNELVILIVVGAASALWFQRSSLRMKFSPMLLVPLFLEAVRTPPAVSLLRLFAIFLEIGAVLYGSGYVLLAFLEGSLVNDLGWITEQQLLDAIVVGQVTPGPLFSTATFLGWQVDGFAGATLATVGIFAPSFVFVALLSRIVPWMRARPTAKAFLQGVNCASLALMAGVLIELAGVALDDVVTVCLALTALAVLGVTRVNSAWLISAGAAVSAIHALI